MRLRNSSVCKVMLFTQLINQSLEISTIRFSAGGCSLSRVSRSALPFIRENNRFEVDGRAGLINFEKSDRNCEKSHTTVGVTV